MAKKSTTRKTAAEKKTAEKKTTAKKSGRSSSKPGKGATSSDDNSLVKAQSSKSRKGGKEVLRFAHPFYTDVPIPQREPYPGAGTRMVDYIATKLEPIPDPLREPTMTLADVIGQDGTTQIENAKAIVFHVTADTGKPSQDMQQPVADAMTAEYDATHPETSPAFFLHVGDVIYYQNDDEGYHEQFYDPYKLYPGKIIAVPGNHDGEVFTFKGASSGQKTTLEAFIKNFCAPTPAIPSAAGTIYRQMVSHPGVYWLLQAPFVDIIGLYSNVAEGPGYIAAPAIGSKQKDWFTKTLTAIQKDRSGTASAPGTRKALIVAVHHPPFSNGGHSPSKEMLKDMDDAFQAAQIMPDAVFSGHSHNYQRFTRFVSASGGGKLQIPFIVVGCGGHNASKVVNPGHQVDDHTLVSSLHGYGYCTVTITHDKLSVVFTQVKADSNHVYDKFEVDLKTNQVT